MIYSRNINVDDYVLVQNPGSPSRFVKKTETNLQQEPTRNLTYWDKYKSAQKIYHLRPLQAVEEFTEQFMKAWPEAGIQMVELLHEVKDPSRVNSAIEATSKRAFLTTFLWLFKAFIKSPGAPCPDVVPNGEGGIDVEWTIGDKLVSLQIHKSNPNNDRIFFKKDAGFSSTELTLVNLLNLLRN
jgi:hypothetical protein